MRAFEYASPKTREQAIALLGKQWGEAEVLAGGSDLLSLMKDEIITPKRLVNIKQIPGMHAIQNERGGYRIGALVTLDQIATAAPIKQSLPMLAHAADEAASPQIRNVATLGGNMCQRPRCWYYRTGFGLLGQQDGKSLVMDGDNRYHAILGNDGPAYFVSPSTVAPVLIAYGATIRIAGPGGERDVPLEKFFRIPQSQDEREHDLKSNEIVTSIFVPSPAAGTKAAAYEVRQKEAFDWPYATAAVALTMNGGTVKSARVVMGHVAPVPWISEEAAQALAGQQITREVAERAAAAAVAKAKPLSRNVHKVQLARVAVKRAILEAAGNERGVA
jgi:xanthine dehydrogenase YagS FAD-binding subunit